MNEPIILYEDNHIIVVLKPQGVPSCEDESKDLDMLTMCKQYIKEKYCRKEYVLYGKFIKNYGTEIFPWY